MFYVYENNQPAILRSKDTNEPVEGWNNNGFETKREAEVYAYQWAYPVSKAEAEQEATEMEIGKPYDYSMGEFPIMMQIMEQ